MQSSWPDPLRQALSDFHQRPTQAANRMAPIQSLITSELQRRLAPLGQLIEVRQEMPLRGKHRTKVWDVVLSFAHRPQLAISTKSIMANVAGTVPNRIDDAMGECVNVHAHDPGMVLGYLFVMNAPLSRSSTRDGRRWIDVFADSLVSFSGRRSERDAPELFEAACLMPVNFAVDPPEVSFHPSLLDWEGFFDLLIEHIRARNPVIDQALRR